MNNKKAFMKALPLAILISNSVVGAIQVFSNIVDNFNFNIGFIYLIISIIAIFLVMFNESRC